jgi:hypothetical protein
VPALRMVVAVLVTLVWASVYLADVLSETFSAPPEISAPMLAVVAWLFGVEVRKAVRNNGAKRNG